jgi:hypothetical protein
MAHPSNHNGGPPLEDERASNWFAVSRDIFDHPIVGIGNRPYTELEAWLSLLAMAEYEQAKRINKGQIVVLDPGQLMAAHSYLANRWKWSSSKVRRFLDLLMMDAMITRFTNEKRAASKRQANDPEIGTQTDNQTDNRRGNQIQIITICNYMKYRPEADANRQANRQATELEIGKQTASEQRENRQQFNKEQITTVEDSSYEESLSAGADAPLPDEPSPKQKRNYGDALEAFNAYNDLAQRVGLPIARSLTPQRRQKLMARLREHGGLESWRIAMANIERSAFLQGRNNRGWTADLDFVLSASKYAKLVDGVYGNGAHAEAKPKETVTDIYARLAEELEQGKRQ